MNLLEEIIYDLIPRVSLLADNQFIIMISNVEYFQSYQSTIGMKGNGYTFLDETYWNYSKQTSKYRSSWLNESTRDTQTKINSGKYILKNLN